jgi:hypothetical protein
MVQPCPILTKFGTIAEKSNLFWDIKPLRSGFSRGLFLEPEDGSDLFFRKVG